MAAPYHQDNYYWNITDKRAVNIWIALDRVAHSLSKAKGTSQEIKKKIINKLKFQYKTPFLYPGDCLIHHCEVIHGSNPNLSNDDRRGIVISLKAKTSKVDKKKLNIYLNKLKKVI